MAGSGGTQQSLRKALGALKDSTKVGLAKVNSDYKDLDVAIVKATNHVERLAKEKHIRIIFDAVSSQRPRADVAYCIHALARRLAKTHNWAVALKTLTVIHRALREVDPTFREELISYTRSRGHMLNLSHFKDDSSPNAWDSSAWVRTYALYVEERLECFRILKYDVESDRSRTGDLDTDDLLEHIPALQQLLFRLLSCQPEGGAVYNHVIQYALSIVASESVKVYSAINEGVLNLVDKFFEMQRHDAVRALEIYKKAGKQTERLSEFYEICRGLELGRQKFIKLEQPPASFITAMEEYVQDAPRTLVLQRNVGNDDRGATPKAVATPREVLSVEQNKETEVEETPEVSETPPEAPQTPPEAPQTPSEAPRNEPSEAPVSPVTDLLGLDELNENASNLDEKNSLALAIATSEGQSSTANNLSLIGENSGWELALVSAQSSNDTAVVGSKLGGGLDKLTLDSLYDDAVVRRTNPNGAYHMGQVGPSFGGDQYNNTADPFSASSSIAPPTNVQMATMTQQQQAFTMQQQQQHQPQQMVNQDPTNPFGNPYVGQGAAPYPPQNHYTGFI